MATIRGAHANDYTHDLCLQCPYPTMNHSYPVFQGDPLRIAVISDPDSYGVSVLPWYWVHMKTCVHLSRLESLFPLVPWSSCTQVPLSLNDKNSRGSSSQCQIPRHGSMMWVPELSLPWVSFHNIFTFHFVDTHLLGMGLLVYHNRPSYHLDVASSFSSGVGFLF